MSSAKKDPMNDKEECATSRDRRRCGICLRSVGRSTGYLLVAKKAADEAFSERDKNRVDQIGSPI